MSSQEGASNRNSWLRKLLALPVNGVADLFLRIGLNANQMTLVGLAGRAYMAMVGYSAVDGNEIRNILLNHLATAPDLFDGAMARRSGKPNPHGEIIDGAADTFAKVIEHLMQALSADSREDYPGMATALLALATCRLPATAKQYAAQKGKACPEIDLWCGGVGGNHPISSLAVPYANFLPEHAWRINAVVAWGNAATAWHRLQIARDAKVAVTLSEDEVQKAINLYQVYLISSILSISLATVVGSTMIAKRLPKF